VELTQVYGATELTGCITVPFDPSSNIYSAGKPIDIHELKIVDTSTGEPLGPLKNGEIIIRTPSIMVHYLTAQPGKSPIDEDGFYHTGDIGHLDEKGYLFITGRIKELIMVRNKQVRPRALLYELGLYQRTPFFFHIKLCVT